MAPAPPEMARHAHHDEGMGWMIDDIQLTCTPPPGWPPEPPSVPTMTPSMRIPLLGIARRHTDDAQCHHNGGKCMRPTTTSLRMALLFILHAFTPTIAATSPEANVKEQSVDVTASLHQAAPAALDRDA